MPRSTPTNCIIPAECKKNDVLRVVLDEPRLYVEESLGSVMVRGEVVVNFLKETPIQGPIELLFEGIQRFETWPEIMRHSVLGSSIETKLQVIELTLLPPNSKGIMPAGIQRFPFEFPIPASLPTSVYIADRMEIYYQLSATIKKSSHIAYHEAKNPINWIDWAKRNSSKKNIVACSPMRIVRAIESISLPINDNHRLTAPSSPTRSSNANSSAESSTVTTPMNEELAVLPWDRRSLSQYRSTLDEQHDQLAFSLSGRRSCNLAQPLDKLQSVQGVRYKIGVDRTAIALGTSVGIELLIEPTMTNAKIKSVTLNVVENRKYAIEVPANHTWDNKYPDTERVNEGVKMVLKWAYGYQMENVGESILDNKNEMCLHSGRYVHQRSSCSQFLTYFDPPQPSHYSKLGNQWPDTKPVIDLDSAEMVHELASSFSSFSSEAKKSCEMINLKTLNQDIKLGEYFGGRFVMPIPDCSNILHPSMDYKSIKINHWLRLTVTVECNGKTFDINLDSPCRILDCRVVSVEDECQTILPPPPTYQPGDDHIFQKNWNSTSTFWEQREAITSVSGWGSCVPCPCQYKKMKKKLEKKCAEGGSNDNNNKKKTGSSNNTAADTCPPELLPEWGPPPPYEV